MDKLQFEELSLEAKKAQANTYAKGTRKNLRSAMKTFILFCVKFGRPVCPTDRQTLMSFAQLMSLTVGYGHIKNLFSAIKLMHKALDQTYPEDDFQVDTTLKAIKRQLAGTPFQTLPITPEILEKLYIFVDIEDPEHLATWCSYLGLVAPIKGANERSYRARDSLSQLSEPSQCYPSGPIIMMF